jgi:hypothetical protein
MMSTTIEADFFPPAVEEIKDTSHSLIADNDTDSAQPVEPSLTKASGSSTFEGSDTKTSPKRAES